MTIEEKRKKIEDYCNSRERCDGCPLYEKEGDCFNGGVNNDDIIENYEILFGNKKNAPAEDPVNRPSHYTDGKIEVIDYIEDKKLGFCLGNAIKYISRAGKKDPSKEIEDLRKAKWYIERCIKEIEEGIA